MSFFQRYSQDVHCKLIARLLRPAVSLILCLGIHVLMCTLSVDRLSEQVWRKGLVFQEHPEELRQKTPEPWLGRTLLQTEMLCMKHPGYQEITCQLYCLASLMP